jgi:N utilization substance protein A
VDYSDDPACFVGNALSPARVTAVNVIDAEARVAQVIVPDYQLSLAIGKEGQNARLAARLTGWRIDIRSDAQPEGTGGDGSRASPAPVASQAAPAQTAQSSGAADAPAR